MPGALLQHEIRIAQVAPCTYGSHPAAILREAVGSGDRVLMPSVRNGGAGQSEYLVSTRRPPDQATRPAVPADGAWCRCGSFRGRSPREDVYRLVERIEEELRAKKVTYSLGIIASYGKQAELLDRELRPRSKRWSALRMRVDTVHAFQGKEDDIIIYSLVRANTSELRFVSDRRMLNVSFSRAKRLLIIVGHQETALNSSQLSKAIEMLPKKNTVKPEEVL